MNGICTLANDRVYDQLVALLNSIEVVLGPEMPICVYPYDANTERIATEIARRPNVTLYDDRDSIDEWDRFVRDVWDSHPGARRRWDATGESNYYRVGTHRRYCAFDGPFDRFVYMDADTLLMGSLEPIFSKLNGCDWVVYDFQFKDPTHVYELSSPKLKEVFSPEEIRNKIFCSGFYASKKDLLDKDKRASLLSSLKEGEVEILYPMAPDQTLLNYMVMQSGFSIYNFALNLPPDERTGCCVTSTHFKERDYVLYDREKRLTYLHYIGLSSRIFANLCQGANEDFPYRDVFLHYRYLHEPEKRPQLSGQPNSHNTPPSLKKRVMKKLGLAL